MVGQIDRKYLSHGPRKVFRRLVAYALYEGRPLTTKGQFFNPLIRLWLALNEVIFRHKRSYAPVFIVGMGRSGTTILGKLLSIHAELVWLNEPKLIWARAFHNEDVIGSYQLNPGRLRLTESDVTELGSRRLHSAHYGACKLTGSNRVLDKYPELVFRADFVRAIFPDAKLIFLFRNSYSVIGSVENWGKDHTRAVGGHIENWWGLKDRKWNQIVEELLPKHSDLADLTADIDMSSEVNRAAVEWIVSTRAGIELVQQRTADAIHVSYDRLCSKPEFELGRILSFCGLGESADLCKYATTSLRPVAPAVEPVGLDSRLQGILTEVQAELDDL